MTVKYSFPSIVMCIAASTMAAAQTPVEKSAAGAPRLIEPRVEQTTLADEISKIVERTVYHDLSDEVVERVEYALLDNAASLAHSTCKTSDHPFLHRLLEKGGAREASLPGRVALIPMEEATAALAYLIHASETDDTDHRASLRASPVVIAPALAVGEAVDATGEDIITSIALGYSVLGALGEPTGPMQVKGLMSSGVYGTISSAIVAAYLLKLTEKETAHAIVLAASASSGLFQYYYDQTEEKRIIIARAARLGVEAALLAKAGEKGALRALEGKAGLYAVLADAPLSNDDAEKILAEIQKLDGPAHIEPKFFATSDSIIPFIKGIERNSQADKVRADEIEKLVLIGDEVYGSVLQDKILHFEPPETSLGAKLNFSFVLSLYFKNKIIVPESYTQQAITSRKVLDLARRVEYKAGDKGATPVLNIYLKSGEVIHTPPVLLATDEPVELFRQERLKKLHDLTVTIWSDEERSALQESVWLLPYTQGGASWVRSFQKRLCGVAIKR